MTVIKRNFKSFPTADGFGKYSLGGCYGEVLFVTNTNDEGSGSFRELIRNQRYPRMIIPLVAGYVRLNSTISVSGLNAPGNYSSGNFTYLGMLAPGDGLVLRDRELRITSCKNFIFRFYKSRHGSEDLVEGDALALSNSPFPDENENFIIDRSTFSWGTDETFSGAGIDLTFQYCLIYEGLHSSVHSKGPHGYGGIWGTKNASFHHNLLSNFFDRCALFQNSRALPDALMDFRNNAIAFWHARPSYVADDVNINLIKNSYTPKGDNSQAFNNPQRFCTFSGTTTDFTGRIYPFGNKMPTISVLTDDVESQKQGIGGLTGSATTLLLNTVVVDTPFPIPVGTYEFDETTDESDAIILEKVGAKRDIIDQRILNEWENGVPTQIGSSTGILGLIDTPTDSYSLTADGYPVLDTTSNPVLTGDAPNYLPSWFITKYNLNPALDYISAGDPSTAPWRFIFFESNVATNYQVTAPLGWESLAHYNVYEVLSFEVTGEIALLTGEIIEPEPTTYTLTVQSSNPTFGTVSRSLSNPVTAGATDILTATPIGTGVFQGWYLGSVIFANFITNDNPYNRVVNSDATIIGHFIDGTPIPPEQPRKKWAKKRNEVV